MAAAAFIGISCTQSEDKEPADKEPTLRILSPAEGAQVKVTDTVLIITRSDYTAFSGGIHVSSSFDSSKTWSQVRSLGPKPSAFVDTIRWYPADEAADPVIPGAKAMLRVTDYGRKFSAISHFFFTH